LNFFAVKVSAHILATTCSPSSLITSFFSHKRVPLPRKFILLFLQFLLFWYCFLVPLLSTRVLFPFSHPAIQSPFSLRLSFLIGLLPPGLYLYNLVYPSSWCSHWTLKMGRIYGPETLVTYQKKTTLCNNPKVITSYYNHGGSFKSHI
jgi:hypothetical protein